MSTGIYTILSPTGKVYIGQTRNFKKREKGYSRLQCPNQTKLHRSFVKHGWKTHIFTIAHELPADVDQSVLDTYEQLYMDAYRSANFILLNLKEGGYKGKHSAESKLKMGLVNIGKVTSGFKGRKHSTESKQKTSEKLKGRIITEESRRKISESNKGKKMSPESIVKRIETMRGFKPSPEALLNMSNAQKGRKHSQETKDKIRAAHKGKKHSPEHNANSANARKGHKMPDYTRQRLAEGRAAKPYSRKGLKTGKPAWNRGLKHSDETRAKMSLTRKGKPSNRWKNVDFSNRHGNI